MCFIIISQVQSKNNKQWNKDTNSTGEQFECDQCFSVDFEILIQNRLICKPYQQWNEVNILILIFTVPSIFLVRKMIRETWLTPSYNNTGQVRHAFLIGTTNDEILTSQVKQEHCCYMVVHYRCLLLDYVKYETRTLRQNGMYLLKNTPTVVIMGYVMVLGTSLVSIPYTIY